MNSSMSMLWKGILVKLSRLTNKVMIVGNCQEGWKTGGGTGGQRGECIHNTLYADMKLSKE